MTEPTEKPSKGRMIVNIILLAINTFISIYFFQFGQLVFGLVFLALALRNAYIIYTEWRARQ